MKHVKTFFHFSFEDILNTTINSINTTWLNQEEKEDLIFNKELENNNTQHDD